MSTSVSMSFPSSSVVFLTLFPSSLSTLYVLVLPVGPHQVGLGHHHSSGITFSCLPARCMSACVRAGCSDSSWPQEAERCRQGAACQLYAWQKPRAVLRLRQDLCLAAGLAAALLQHGNGTWLKTTTPFLYPAAVSHRLGTL